MPFRNREEYFNSYTEQIRVAEIKVLPIVRSGGTDWKIRVFTDSTKIQGPAAEVDRLTPEMLERALNVDFGWLNIDAERIEEINKAREWADKFLYYDSDYNRKTRGDAAMDELIELSSKGQVEEWQHPRNLI